MKPCRKNRKLIAWLLLDALDGSQKTELTQHLQQCEGCRRYREEISLVTRQLSILEPTEAVVESTRNIVHAASRHPRRSGSTIFSFSPAHLLAWRLIMPALCIVALGLLVLSALLRNPVSSPPSHSFAQTKLPTTPSTDLLPTVANYRLVANQSLDELDDLLARQGRKPVPSSPTFSAGTLAFLRVAE